MKVLFICTGNTCRSPMAEALLKHESQKFKVQSAGIYAAENEPANPHAIKVLNKMNISHQHVSKQVTAQLLDWADIVLTMTAQHKQVLMTHYPVHNEKYFTLKEYALDLATSNGDISDPFGREASVYEETLQEIKTYIGLIIKRHG